MKRILITSINGRFDELLIGYFISQQYNVRILADFVDPGCDWLKWPVEIYSCSLNNSNELVQAIRGCDFVIANHCNPLQPGSKNQAIPAPLIPGSANQHMPRLKGVVYLKEGIDLAENGYRPRQRKCIKKTLSLLNTSNDRSQKGRDKTAVRSIFVDAAQAVHAFENNLPGHTCFEILGERIHDAMRYGSQNETFFIQINNEVVKIGWKILVRSWIETGLERMLRIVRLTNNLTGF